MACLCSPPSDACPRHHYDVRSAPSPRAQPCALAHQPGPTHSFATARSAPVARPAGLPRALVDVRHDATHGELPSLPLLRAAAAAGLDWLRASYWCVGVAECLCG